MQKRKNLYVILFAFLFGQAIQLVTNALAHYLYVSDPVMLCITTAIITVALVVLTAVFTLMDNDNLKDGEHTAMRPGGLYPIKKQPLNAEKTDLSRIQEEKIEETDINIFKGA